MPDSYIVRIYRRSRKNPRLIAGVVERVGDESWKAGFENAEEMQGILTGSGQAAKNAEALIDDSSQKDIERR
jgi:hypothetical protein